MKLIQKIPFVFLFMTSSCVFAQELSITEKNIVQYIDKHQENQHLLLKQLVNINSGTNNIKGVIAVGNKLKPQLEQLGFKTYWVQEPASMHRAPTLIAERKGTKGKKLLLIGHLDTVFPKNSTFQRFERQGENSATGPGVIDDKGGDVVILYALKALNSVHALDNTTITIVLPGDEEDSGKPTSISRKPLIEAAQHSDIALDFECDISQDTATIGRRGITMWKLNTTGIQAHSALIFKKDIGDGAVYELARILNEFRELFEHDNNISLNSALVLGGTDVRFDKNNAQGRASGKENVIAKTAVATGDFRFTSKVEYDQIKQKMKDVVAHNLPHTHATVEFQDGIPAMTPTKANQDLLEKYSVVSQALGYGPIKPLPPNIRGAGDISHIAEHVSASLAGLGPLGNGAHSLKESIDLPSLSMQTKRTAVFIYQLVNS